MMRREHTLFSLIFVLTAWVLERFLFHIVLADFLLAFLCGLMMGTFADLDLVLVGSKTGAKYHRHWTTHSVLFPGLIFLIFLIAEFLLPCWNVSTPPDLLLGLGGWLFLGYFSLAHASHLILDLFPSDQCVNRWGAFKQMMVRHDAPGCIKGIKLKHDAYWLLWNAALSTGIFLFSLIYAVFF